jgi:hypothetical protein
MKIRLVWFAFLAAGVTMAGPTFERTWQWRGHNYGRTVDATADGGYVLGTEAGDSVLQHLPITIMKTDSLGDSVWTRSFAGTGARFGGYACVIPSGYVIAGTQPYNPMRHDVVVFCDDPSGNPVWSYDYLRGANKVCDAASTPDGGVAVLGELIVTTLAGPGLIRLDSAGSLVWMKVVSLPYRAYPRAVQVTPDRGFVISLASDSLEGAADSFWLLRTDSLGDTLWTRNYGGRVSGSYSVCVTDDGGFAVGARTVGSSGRDVGCLLRTNAVGESLWTRRYELDTFFTSEVRAVSETHDHGFILAGTATYATGSSPLWLLRTDSVGNMLWYRAFLPWRAHTAVGRDIKETADHGFVVIGDADSARVYLVKTDSLGGFVPGVAESPHCALAELVLTASPNPANRYVRIRYALPGTGRVQLRIHDVAGRLARTCSLDSNEATLDLGGLPAGIYLFDLKRAGCAVRGRLSLN